MKTIILTDIMLNVILQICKGVILQLYNKNGWSKY